VSEQGALPVGATVLAAWRQFAARPDYVLRVGWIPALVVFAIGAFSGASRTGPAMGNFWIVIAALLNFAMMVQVLVAWQRYALPESHPRKGLSGLRAGRAEIFSLVHFPLVLILFVPLRIPTLIESVVATPSLATQTTNTMIGLVGLALLVFPGGLLLMRAALMLTAIAAAGNRRVALLATANRVWKLGAGNSIRLLLVFYLTTLPVAAVIILLPPDLPAVARAAAHGILLVLYVMLSGGALAGCYGRLAATAGGPRKGAS